MPIPYALFYQDSAIEVRPSSLFAGGLPDLYQGFDRCFYGQKSGKLQRSCSQCFIQNESLSTLRGALHFRRHFKLTGLMHGREQALLQMLELQLTRQFWVQSTPRLHQVLSKNPINLPLVFIENCLGTNQFHLLMLKRRSAKFSPSPEYPGMFYGGSIL